MSSELFTVKEHTVPGQHIRDFPRATAKNQEDILYLHVKQYIPKSSSPIPDDAITIVACHANGFPKELYEPLWDELVRSTRGKLPIRGIWIADLAWEGQSYAINEEIIGNDPSWFDNSRDVLQIINHFRAEMPRPLVALGHSFGGTQLVNLSLFHARLFAALVIIDPPLGHAIAPRPSTSDPASKKDYGVATASTFRRDLWPSLEAARAAFLKSPFYRGWDSRVFDKWMQYGLRELPTKLYPTIPPELSKNIPANSNAKPVTLATTKHQEVWSFIRPRWHGPTPSGPGAFDKRQTPDILPEELFDNLFYRSESLAVLERLPYLRPPTLFVFGETSNLGTPETQWQRVSAAGTGRGGSGGKKDGAVTSVVVKGVGHLVPMEDTNAAADFIGGWLRKWYVKWRAEEEIWKEERRRIPDRDMVHVSQQWTDWMKGNNMPKL